MELDQYRLQKLIDRLNPRVINTKVLKAKIRCLLMGLLAIWTFGLGCPWLAATISLLGLVPIWRILESHINDKEEFTRMAADPELRPILAVFAQGKPYMQPYFNEVLPAMPPDGRGDELAPSSQSNNQALLSP